MSYRGLEGLTEISRVVIRWTVKTQVLQVRDEIRDGSLVDALTLTEDVQLGGKKNTGTELALFPTHHLPERTDQ